MGSKSTSRQAHKPTVKQKVKSTPAKRKLTNKRRAFIEAYLSNGFNGTQAAIAAGFSAHTARSMASQLLANIDISTEIEARFSAMTMTATEVLARLSDEAEASMANFITFIEMPPIKNPDGTETPVPPEPEVNLYQGYQRGVLHHVKKVKQTIRTYGQGKDRVVEKTFDIEVVDAHAARVVLGKHHKVLNDKVEVEHIIPPELIELARKYGLKASDIFEQMVNVLGKARVNVDE